MSVLTAWWLPSLRAGDPRGQGRNCNIFYDHGNHTLSLVQYCIDHTSQTWLYVGGDYTGGENHWGHLGKWPPQAKPCEHQHFFAGHGIIGVQRRLRSSRGRKENQKTCEIKSDKVKFQEIYQENILDKSWNMFTEYSNMIATWPKALSL